MSADLLKHTAQASQVVLIGFGLVLLWKLFLSPAARAQRPPARLPAWNASLIDAMRFMFHGLGAGFVASFLVGALARPLGLTGDALTISATAALHFGALIGFACHLYFNPVPTSAPSSGPGALRAGLATFVIAMPLVVATNLGWLGLLKLFGVEVERQPAIELVGRIGGSVWFFVFVLSAVVLAPAAEELLFRAGLFRLFRSRKSRPVALVVPALLFAAIHFHLPSYLPLALLGIIFSLSYERTGQIATPIVAHAAFNLNNLLMVLAGADQ